MTLQQKFEKSGNWLFRWRSFLPLVMIALFAIAIRDFYRPFADPQMDLIWELVCLSVSLVGLAIRVIAGGYVPSGTSGRNTKKQAASVLNTTGVYSVVRHPLYLGNFIIWLGLSLFVRVWWFSAVVILTFWLYYEKIMFAEERFLEKKFGDEFLEWAAHTPAFFPRWRNYQASVLPFSWKTALAKEYSTLFSITLSFTVLDIVSDLLTSGQVEVDPVWVGIFGITLLFYVIVRILKKFTNLLKVEGR
jgi:protein-S-isoprenylcysteine O-methyltransferase Ste14